MEDLHHTQFLHQSHCHHLTLLQALLLKKVQPTDQHTNASWLIHQVHELTEHDSIVLN
jgi:hypothetical protein